MKPTPLDYACPTCGAAPGMRCTFSGLFDGRTPRQYARMNAGTTHRARERRAQLRRTAMKNTTAPKVVPPTPHHIDSRICFAIAYFTTEADATAYDCIVRERGDCYNGGYFHGMACGRDTGFDYTKQGQRYFAVTTR